MRNSSQGNRRGIHQGQSYNGYSQYQQQGDYNINYQSHPPWQGNYQEYQPYPQQQHPQHQNRPQEQYSFNKNYYRPQNNYYPNNHNNQRSDYHAQEVKHFQCQYSEHNGFRNTQIQPRIEEIDHVSHHKNFQRNFFRQTYSEGTNETEGKIRVGRYGRREGYDRDLPSKHQTSKPSPQLKQKIPCLVEQSINQAFTSMGQKEIKYSTCPFNDQHIVLASRLLTHIHKCKESYEYSSSYINCPYDPCHYFRIEKIEAHKLVCDKRWMFEMRSGWDDLPNVRSSWEEREVEKKEKKQVFMERVESRRRNIRKDTPDF